MLDCEKLIDENKRLREGLIAAGELLGSHGPLEGLLLVLAAALRKPDGWEQIERYIDAMPEAPSEEWQNERLNKIIAACP